MIWVRSKGQVGCNRGAEPSHHRKVRAEVVWFRKNGPMLRRAPRALLPKAVMPPSLSWLRQLTSKSTPSGVDE